MDATPDALFDAAMKLPALEREELAARLMGSVDQERGEPPLDPAWDEEIARRVEEIRAGNVKGVPSEDVFRRMRAIGDA
ncbi:addiction module protein [Botrimarina sp.]|uniref:addiction module protein n=1 Tax=Botrimarina sp. TaxID=2795802 RepID=UPI0032EFF67D